MKKYIIIALLLSSFFIHAQKEYDLRWYDYKPGFQLISKIKVISKHQRFTNKDQKIGEFKTTQEYITFWQVINRKNDMIYATLMRRNGQITIQENKKPAQTYSIIQVEQLAKKNRFFYNFKNQMSGGTICIQNLKNGYVRKTWDILVAKRMRNTKTKRDKITYKKVLKNEMDPYNIRNSFRIIPNKVVPLKYKWKRELSGKAKETLMFTKVIKKKGRRFAVIKAKGTQFHNRKKIGILKSTYYFDLDNKVLQSRKELKTFKFKQKDHYELIRVYVKGKLLAINRRNMKKAK